MPLCYWLAYWAHHQAPVFVFWTLLLSHSQLSNQMFGWFFSHVSLIHRNQNFTPLKRELRQGEHEDLVENSHQAAGHCRSLLVSQLALVALHTDPGVESCSTQRRQIRSYESYPVCVWQLNVYGCFFWSFLLFTCIWGYFSEDHSDLQQPDLKPLRGGKKL